MLKSRLADSHLSELELERRQWPEITLVGWLHLFDLSPLCVINCILKSQIDVADLLTPTSVRRR